MGTLSFSTQPVQPINTMIGLGNTEEAKTLWKKLVGYHRRSLVEAAFSRFKGIFGDRFPGIKSYDTNRNAKKSNGLRKSLFSKISHPFFFSGLSCKAKKIIKKLNK